MERRQYQRLFGPRRTDRGAYFLRVLSARELLEAKREAEALCERPEEQALWAGAAVLARAAETGAGPLFPDGEAVAKTWSAEKIAREMELYQELAGDDPEAEDSEGTLERLADELEKLPRERLHWKVLRAFLALPTEQRARDMTEGDYLYCGAQLLLDRREALSGLCPSCRRRAEEAHCAVCGRSLAGERGANPQFDEKRFEELKGNG